jgi:hypothetical protein
MKLRWLIVFTVLMSLLGTAFAQDSANPDADPLFATVDLIAGGENLDPFLISVLATGTVDASTVADGCVGFIPPQPDVALNWTGESDMLRIFFYSIHDATLTVVTPDGDVFCNDDASGTLFDPLVDIENPVEGRYAIHVGHFSADQEYPGLLVITSDDTYGPSNFSPASLVDRDIIQANEDDMLPLDIMEYGAPPLNEDLVFNLEAGFGTQSFEVTESGQIPLFDVRTNNVYCTGFVEILPTAVFNLTGESELLEVYAEGDHDSSLLVFTPSGEIICNDDALSGGENLNPQITIETPELGRYVIYMGSHSPGEDVNATVTIAEDGTGDIDTLTAEDIMDEEE